MHRATGEPVVVGRVEAMSKSKRNTVDPEAIIARYGADTARWFILSDNPPERDMEWTEAGVAGAFRFTQRVFRLVENPGAAPTDGHVRRRPRPAPRHPPHDRRGQRGAGQLCVQRRGGAALRVGQRDLRDAGAGRLGRTRSRRGPARGGGDARPADRADDAASGRGDVHVVLHPASATLVAELPWPEADPDLLAAETVTIAVQVMGKLRGTIAVPPDAPAEAVIAAAEAEPNVARALAGKRVVKRVHVPNRIVNFVVAG